MGFRLPTQAIALRVRGDDVITVPGVGAKWSVLLSWGASVHHSLQPGGPVAGVGLLIVAVHSLGVQATNTGHRA